MKKRKIRYDRILLPILILCVIIFGISSCHKTEETKVQSKPIHTTTTFLKNALKPVGQTLYISYIFMVEAGTKHKQVPELKR